MASFEITPQHCHDLGIDAPPRFKPQEEARVVDWLSAVLSPALRKRIGCYRETAAQREYENLAEHIAEYTEIGDRSDWTAWTEGHALNVKPLNVTAQARDLFARGKYVVMLSATILDFATFQRTLGIPDSVQLFSAPSDFPLANRPIIFMPAGDMSRSTIEATIPKLCRLAAQIVAEFNECKGIIHTHSYDLNQQVFSYLRARFGSRIITHGRDKGNRDEAIEQHRASEDASVLVSPSLTEGVDMKDDLARFQIVCKVPYPRLDTYTCERKKRDQHWYQLQTAHSLMQMIGRCVRSKEDHATTFVLDSQFEYFMKRNEGIIPAWWRAAIQTRAKAA